MKNLSWIAAVRVKVEVVCMDRHTGNFCDLLNLKTC